MVVVWKFGFKDFGNSMLGVLHRFDAEEFAIRWWGFRTFEGKGFGIVMAGVSDIRRPGVSDNRRDRKSVV